MDITQHGLDRADLVVLVGHDGLVEWSANRSRVEVADMLHDIADSIEDGDPVMTTATASGLVAAGYQPCPAQDAPAPQGTPVWSARLEWSLASGTMIRDRYGVGGGELGQPATLTVRRAASEYICGGCRHVIARGAPHGSNAGAHYCGCCITTVRPADQFKKAA